MRPGTVPPSDRSTGAPPPTGSAAAGLRLGVDVGGTFTDLVAVDGEGRLVLAKVPSVPADQSRGVLAAVARSGVPAAGVERFAHGTTVATNALLERRGVRTALVTTAGFRDVIEIGRQNRPSLYDLTLDRPPPLVPRELRFTVTERCAPNGVVVPLDLDEVSRLAERLAAIDGLGAVAVGLLFSFAHPEHERRVGEVLRAALPGVTVTLSCEVLPQFREYERFATTVADAYLTPLLAGYLDNLARATAAAGLPEPLVMQSSGGVVDLPAAAAHAAGCVLSGPAGGAVGAAYVAGLSGEHDLLTFDMGGTSTDVAPVLGGRVTTTSESLLAGVPITLPTVDVHSVSAGGGSVAWVDSGGALRVGPHSAGADPGPACYGRGGTDATVTDADLLLGHLADGASLGGDVTLSAAAAAAALGRLAARLGPEFAAGTSPVVDQSSGAPAGGSAEGRSPEGGESAGDGLAAVRAAAAGVIAVADAEMTRALRVVSVERGLDPRELALVAFGGAGAMHACALAEELGIGRILVPLACGVLSALGLALSDVRRDYLLPLHGRLAEPDDPADTADPGAADEARGRAAGAGPPLDALALDAPAIDAAAARLAALAEHDLPGATHERWADARYAGQSHELTVAAAGGPTELRAAFEAEHERRYGYRAADTAVEVVALRLVATLAGRRPTPPQQPEEPTRARPAGTPSASRATAAPVGSRTGAGGWSRRDLWVPEPVGGAVTRVPADIVPRGALGVGDVVPGPAVVEFDEATCLVRAGWTAVVDQVGTLCLIREPD
ncbi:MAG: hydantoinase/oxoprolinase family protein [Frankia sp.]